MPIGDYISTGILPSDLADRTGKTWSTCEEIKLYWCHKGKIWRQFFWSTGNMLWSILKSEWDLKKSTFHSNIVRQSLISDWSGNIDPSYWHSYSRRTVYYIDRTMLSFISCYWSLDASKWNVKEWTFQYATFLCWISSRYHRIIGFF